MINQIKIYYIIVIFIFKKITKFNNHTKTQKILIKNIFSKYNETSKKKKLSTTQILTQPTPPLAASTTQSIIGNNNNNNKGLHPQKRHPRTMRNGPVAFVDIRIAVVSSATDDPKLEDRVPGLMRTGTKWRARPEKGPNQRQGPGGRSGSVCSNRCDFDLFVLCEGCFFGGGKFFGCVMGFWEVFAFWVLGKLFFYFVVWAFRKLLFLGEIFMDVVDMRKNWKRVCREKFKTYGNVFGIFFRNGYLK